MAGLRVVRGPDWKWDHQDGGEGYVGTGTGDTTSTGWMNILWDNGKKNDYRIGADDAADLRVLDNGPARVCHPHVQCDACSENGVRGIRWKCIDCPDYDLCTECYGNDKHDIQHRFKRFDISTSVGVNIGKRQHAAKLQSRGLYVGASVKRGHNWDDGNDDGGAGSVGKVIQVGYIKQNNIHKSALVVKWPKGKDRCICRLGLGGNVDVQYVTEAIGWGYYRDHMPEIRNLDLVAEETVQAKPDSDDSDDDEDALGKLLLLSMAGLAGALSGVRVTDRSARREEVMRRFSPGDIVRMSDDLEKIRRLQNGHGGFNLLMIGAMGELGVIEEIDEDGDLKVSFSGIKWALNPDCVTKQIVIKTVESSNTSASNTENLNQPSAAATSNKFQVGDSAMMIGNIEQLKRLQEGHGGWIDDMKRYMDKPGRVIGITAQGNVKVDFSGKFLVMNPDALKKMGAGVESPAATNDFAASNRFVKALPALPPASEKFKVGDNVKIGVPTDKLKELQRGHGGWTDGMLNHPGAVGKIKDIDSDGDIKVVFPQGTWTMNPETCALAKTAAVSPQKSESDGKYGCQKCHQQNISVVFNCGHGACETCAQPQKQCHVCNKPISNKTKMVF